MNVMSISVHVPGACVETGVVVWLDATGDADTVHCESSARRRSFRPSEPSPEQGTVTHKWADLIWSFGGYVKISHKNLYSCDFLF